MGVFVIQSQKDKTPRQWRDMHGGRKETRWKFADKGERLDLTSIRDCASNRAEKGGPNEGDCSGKSRTTGHREDVEQETWPERRGVGILQKKETLG